MRTSALFGAKSFGFFEIFGVSARSGREPVRQLWSIFRDFIADVFYGRPL